uniref:Vacuolar protein sorting-associated protein 52 homolog n=1 Tax=Neolamprologus brichardi TaxID=32507 RepID=A0A3Q4HTR8_NEOBR
LSREFDPFGERKLVHHYRVVRLGKKLCSKETSKCGVDLRQYSKQVEAELQRIEQASIKDYIKESQNIALLHNQITACDSILERMEGMLSGFQSDLSSISSEIQTLQQQSVSMNVRLKNRQAVRSHLSQLVDELVVPGAMISTILDSPVTEQEFLEQLHELNTKINFAKELSFRETLACSDIQDIVDRLKLKVRDGREEICITLNPQTSFLCCFCPFKEQDVHFYTRGTETSLKTLVSVTLLVCHMTENPEHRSRVDPGGVCAENLCPQVYLPAAAL